MARKAKILAILLVFCLLAAVYAPAVSAGGYSSGGPNTGDHRMWKMIYGGNFQPSEEQPTVGPKVTREVPDLLEKKLKEKKQKEEEIARSISKRI